MTQTEARYVIGLDFGTDSVRAAVIDPRDGQTVSSGVAYYPRWKQGLYQHPARSIFRQHPLDHLESLEQSVKTALAALTPAQRSAVAAIGLDTTGSTPVAVDRAGVPLALREDFRDCEEGMFQLWKEHAAADEAEEILQLLSGIDEPDYLKFVGKYSSEAYWSKILHTIRSNAHIREAAYAWVEHCDWMVGVLCGNTDPETMYHCACAAGHKMLWHSSWNGLPDAETLARLDPYLATVRDRAGTAPQPADVRVGSLCPEWAERLGLSTEVVVSGCSIDAHAGAVGAGIREGTMVCALGTSSVGMVVVKPEQLQADALRGRACLAENSILPGYIGIEVGQAAFGDLFAWFKKLLLWPIRQAETLLPPETFAALYAQMEDRMLRLLTEEAQALSDEVFPIALDWFNGRRFPDQDDTQQAMLQGLTLGVEAPHLFRSLVFAALCGLKRLVDGFEQGGLVIDELVAIGGISKKSDFLMQMMADLLGKPVAVLEAEQTCAVGAAMYAAVAGGFYDSIEAASVHMVPKKCGEYAPDPERTAFYALKYQDYLWLAEMGDALA